MVRSLNVRGYGRLEKLLKNANKNYVKFWKAGFLYELENPHREDLSPDLIIRILKQAGISREEWIDETQ